jgi:hypothetical protein
MRCGIVLRLPNYQSVDLNKPENRLRIDTWREGLNLRSHLEICHGKQAHADIAEIDTKTIQLGRLGEYLHGGVQQLAFPASPVWFEAPFEDHLSTRKDTVAKRSLRAKITDVQWNVERWFNPYLVVASLPSQPLTERNLRFCSLFLILSNRKGGNPSPRSVRPSPLVPENDRRLAG